ncbi:hypothetical protein ABL78_7537 [Leptomonas seymouri]|uniref:Uncharacterized protein n=1 Tax=Leptomonas seymouri TaxID=5684 RepID=A0A0N0P2W3_LEPSE|nr:hypothetical protein ABL78_7537 [Leptomonas seymouri]|eukprot:KPI83429.1 hypothetical protein ABL78_7537 [Leptomonas seymouri]
MPLQARIPELEVIPLPLKLEDAPEYHDEWNRQHPALSLLYHHDIITHLVWCAVACRYLTGGADGEVKIWKSEPSHSRSTPMLSTKTAAGGPARPWLLPERHILTLSGPVTGIFVTDKETGSSEVAVITSTDGTLTLCRTNTGEIVRTLRGARGESLESHRVPAARARSANVPEAEKEEPTSGPSSNRSAEPLHSYAADAVSRHLTPVSDVPIVRRPIYTIQAYRNEVRDVFSGPSNSFFHGLRAVAPTYAHLAPHEEMVADVLVAFGTHTLTTQDDAETSTAVMPRQWYASAVALAVAPDMSHGTSAATSGDNAPLPSHDLYLLLGFPEGLLQAYVLPWRWFQLHLHSETRLDPPSIRFPIASSIAHTAAIIRIEVLPAKDLVASVSEDGTTQLRRLTALHAPLRQLGACILPGPQLFAASLGMLSSSTHTGALQNPGNAGLNQGHSRCITCCCVNAAHQLLITGGADHMLCWWSLMAGSPSTPVRVLSLRDASSNLLDVAAAAAAAGPPPVRGGYPVDVSFFFRRHGLRGGASVGDGEDGQRALGNAGRDMLLLVLDTEQVVRVFDALSGKLLLIQTEDSSAAAVAPSCGDARVRRSMRLARYDKVNGADRLLLGGLSLVPWYLSTPSESSAVDGHMEPIIFSTWSASLKCVVSADEHHVLLWRLGEISGDYPQNDATSAVTTSPQMEDTSSSVEVLRVWKIPQGIRCIALCESERPDEVDAAPPSLLIALKEQPLLMQYDCLSENPFQTSTPSKALESGQLREPLPLRLLALRMKNEEAGDFPPNITVLAAVSSSMRHNSVHVETPTDAPGVYVCAVRPCGSDNDARGSDSGQGSVLMYALRDTAAGMATTDSSAVNLFFPSREIHFSQRSESTDTTIDRNTIDEVVSVLAVPTSGLLVLGGHRELYVSSLFSSTSSAVPCSLLPPAPVGLRQPRRGAAASRCVTAVFPGPLTPYDKGENIVVQDKSDVANGDAVAADKLTVDVASSTASLEGYLSRLVHISIPTEAAERENMAQAKCDFAQQLAAPCLILSGSNVGVVQLWDASGWKELWRCHTSLSQEPITALSVQRCGGARWLVAVGGQTGSVTVLDITGVINSTQRRTGVSPAAPLCARSRDETESDFMVDRWQAHTEVVSGVCFGEAAAQTGEGQALFTTGEDMSIVAWTLTLLPSKVFGCVQRGKKLFKQRAGYSLNPKLIALPWETQNAYAKLRERYVRHCLFDRYPELMSAFRSLYAQPATVSRRPVREEKEAALLDNAWDALVADTHYLLSATGKTPWLDEATVRDWCVSLTAALSSSPHCSTAYSGTHNGAAGGSLPTASLILAFADRCCGADPRMKENSQRPAAQTNRDGRASVVRKCLRDTVRAVVQATIAHRVQRTSPPPPPLSTAEAPLCPKTDANTVASTNATVPRPAAELFSAVATITALACMPVPVSSTTAPSSGAATPTSSPVPGPPSVSNKSIAAGLNDVPPTTPRPQAGPPAPTTRRVLFEDNDQQNGSSKKAAATDTIPSAASSSLGYRVNYGSSAPLVRSAPVSAENALTKTGRDHMESPRRRPSTAKAHTQGSNEARGSFAVALEVSSTEGRADESSSADSDDNDSDAAYVATGEVRAAAVVERVHRSRRRRGDAMQLLAANGQEDGSQHPVAGERRVAQNNQKFITNGNAPQLARPVVGDTYLTPALARVKTNALHANNDARSSSSSSQLSWYAMRQRKRDAAQEKARLWNTLRVMRTLMGWEGTAPMSDATSPDHANAAPSELKGQAELLPVELHYGTAANGAIAGAQCVESSRGLTLPHILSSHLTESHVVPHACAEGSLHHGNGLFRTSPDPSALPLLLHVSPTAAIDAAVQAGLPTRATLRSEMTAMQTRMRQSVQQRATQQRLQLATTAGSVGDAFHAAVEHKTAGVVSRSALTDGMSDNATESNDLENVDRSEDSQASPHFSPMSMTAPAPANKESAYNPIQMSNSMMARTTAASLSSRHRLAATRSSRTLQGHNRTDARRMATVPLPNATTRSELFLHRSGGGKV